MGRLGDSLAARRAFIVANTRLQSPPHTPELVLHLADEVTPIWKLTEAELGEIGLPPPFWAFAWAGGQALARYLIDHPSVVAGLRVVDFATGSGIVAIAAARAGAVDVLAADICYERPLAERVMAWLAAARRGGVRVLIGDPGRTYFPKTGLVRLAEYQVATTRELEDAEVKRTSVWALP